MNSQQILRLADQRRDAAKCRSDCAVHQQIAKHTAECCQVLAGFVADAGVVRVIVVRIEAFAGRYLVIDGIKTGGHGDDHGHHGQRVQKGG